jgi:predicted PurR-regulated permease PerM
LRIAVGLVAAALIAAALAQASTVFAPLALALFIIAIVRPLQHWLQVRMPKLLALAVTILLTVSVCIAFWLTRRLGVQQGAQVDRQRRGALPGAL